MLETSNYDNKVNVVCIIRRKSSAGWSVLYQAVYLKLAKVFYISVSNLLSLKLNEETTKEVWIRKNKTRGMNLETFRAVERMQNV